MNLITRLIEWANRPSAEEQIEAMFKDQRTRLEAAMTHAISLRAENDKLRAQLEQYRNLDRGPLPGTIELTLRTFGPNGAPLAARYMLHRQQFIFHPQGAVGEILADRCRELYHAITERDA